MLYLITNTKEYTFHMGENKAFNKPFIEDIIEIQADCDELELIKNLGVFVPNKLVVRWFGDDAKFIAANCFY
jgi:hypothetical protein